MSRVVGAYACARGVFVVECRRRSAGLQVLRSLESHAGIESPQEAVARLNGLLAQAGIRRSLVALAVRGFGATHHVLTFPPAADAVLNTIVDREVRRLEPDMQDPVIAWARLSRSELLEAEQPQATLMVAAVSRDVADAFVSGIQGAGHTLAHFTALQVGVQRLAEELAPPPETTAVVAHLPDGPYLGFWLDGAVRLVVEPPVRPEDALPDAGAVAEEAELGVVFVRQQFRGAQVTRAAVIASDESWPDLETALAERLGVAVGRVQVGGLGAGPMAAFGALLDARAQQPVALRGRAVRRIGQPSGMWRSGVAAALALMGLVGTWTITSALEARATASALQNARRRIDQESSGIAPLRETVERRKLVRDAVAAIQGVTGDRAELLRGLASVAAAVAGPVSVDSILVVRAPGGWRAEIGGTVIGSTNGRAVQALSDFYRDLPRRARVDSLSLGQLFYADSSGRAFVHFQISFGLPRRKSD